MSRYAPNVDFASGQPKRIRGKVARQRVKAERAREDGSVPVHHVGRSPRLWRGWRDDVKGLSGPVIITKPAEPAP